MIRPLLLLAAIQLVPTLHAQTYRVTKLNTLFKDNGYHLPVAINNSGSIACQSQTALASPTRATLFRRNGKGNKDLGTLGGNNSGANDVNALNAAVGFAELATGVSRAVLFSGIGASNTQLGTLDDGNASATSVASSINDDGDIVGQAYNSGFANRATLFSGTGTGNTDLGTLGGTSSYASCINAAGVIVGSAQTATGATHATRFSGTGGGNTDLGTLTGGVNSYATCISGSGHIVGMSDTADFKSHAVRFGIGDPQDLGTLGGKNSSAASVNVAGDIVGTADSPGGPRAFIIRGFGRIIDLNTLIPASSGVVLTNARDINNKGQIIAAVSTRMANPATPTFSIPSSPSKYGPRPNLLEKAVSPERENARTAKKSPSSPNPKTARCSSTGRTMEKWCQPWRNTPSGFRKNANW